MSVELALDESVSYTPIQRMRHSAAHVMAEAVQEIMFQRPEALAYLQSLRAAYVSGGAKALTQALHQPIHHPDHKFRVTANTKRLLLLDLPDPQAQIDSIDVDLATAATRTSWLR